MTQKRKQFTTLKCKVKNNRKIQETQTNVTSTIPYVDFTSHGSVSKIKTQDACKTFMLCDILMRYCFLLYNVSIVSILRPSTKLKYLYFIKTIESNIQFIKLNFLKMYILAVAKRYLHCIYLK